MIALNFSEQSHISSLRTLFPLFDTDIFSFQLSLLYFNSRIIHARYHWDLPLWHILSTYWVLNKNNREAHPVVQPTGVISSVFTKDASC